MGDNEWMGWTGAIKATCGEGEEKARQLKTLGVALSGVVQAPGRWELDVEDGQSRNSDSRHQNMKMRLHIDISKPGNSWDLGPLLLVDTIRVKAGIQENSADHAAVDR